MKALHRFALTLATAALIWPALAQADEEWSKSRKLQVDTTATGASIDAPVAQLPLLVRLHSGNFVFSEAKPDGSDLRFFTADGKTALKFHLERYDAANEMAFAWVQMPTLAPNVKADALLMKWGNPAATGAGDRAASYDANHVLVLNFSDPEGVKDATANANHAREFNGTAVGFGAIGGAGGFNGKSRLTLPASASLKLSASEGWTYGAWVKAATLDKATLLSMGVGSQALSIELVNGAMAVKSGNASAQATTPLKVGNWQHVAISYGAGKARFYLDGVPAGESALVLADAAGEAVIGTGLQGDLDAVTLSNTARSPAYITAQVVSQRADSPMLAFAVDDESSDEVSYMAILLGAVTVDGWVVIGILGVMAVVSLWVMISKTITLGRMEKANATFLEMFSQNANQLLDPDSAAAKDIQGLDKVQASSIFRLYAVGLVQLAQRFDAQLQAQQKRQLSAAALESIRAALDANIVRGNQKMNSGIVLLTISISGGPFLGLLGTVVGVMITFAAIAAAGDVNVNAIAPGIAAALVATVAGLAVAIPALFAYNWFAIKIKNIAADTTVFADEFLTKSAELHSQ